MHSHTHRRVAGHVLRTFTEEMMHEMTLACPNTPGAAARRDALRGSVDLGQDKLEVFWMRTIMLSEG